MRAFAIDEFGAQGSVRDLPEPTPTEGHVRVRVAAASVNPADRFMMAGAYKDFMPTRFPLIPGTDLAGTVDALGPGVEGLKVGDEVYGGQGKPLVGEGTLAEYVVATVGSLAPRPSGLDSQTAAAFPLAGVSALFMVDAAELAPGDPVLVIGAAGGIGSFALQLIAAAGAKPIAVARTVNHGYVRGLGAAEVIDYTLVDAYETVHAGYPEGISAIFDLSGDRELVARLAGLVRKGGHVVSMARAADEEALAAAGITGVNIRTMVTTARLEQLAALVESGAVRPPQVRTFPLDQAGDAFAELAARHVRGKLVILA